MDEPRGRVAVTTARFARVRELFESALDQPPARRGAFLAAACGGDVALVQAVERLLVADQEQYYLLDRSAAATHTDASFSCLACRSAVDPHQVCPGCGMPAGAPRAVTAFPAGAV